MFYNTNWVWCFLTILISRGNLRVSLIAGSPASSGVSRLLVNNPTGMQLILLYLSVRSRNVPFTPFKGRLQLNGLVSGYKLVRINLPAGREMQVVFLFKKGGTIQKPE